MLQVMLPTREDIISDILNWVCPECGGPMGGRTQEFKCQGECRTDWRDVWEVRVGKPGKKANSPRLSAKSTRTMRRPRRRGRPSCERYR